jgi:hypothetical protein
MSRRRRRPDEYDDLDDDDDDDFEVRPSQSLHQAAASRPAGERRGVFAEILHLSKTIRSASKANERREAALELQEKLADPDVQRRLMEEVRIPDHDENTQQRRGRPPSTDKQVIYPPRESDRMKRRRALNVLWGLIVRNSVLAIREVSSDENNKRRRVSTKLNLADVMLPYRLVRLCDAAFTRIVGATVASANTTTSPNNAMVPLEYAELRLPCSLGRGERELVLEYCLSMLNSQEALDVAEVDLLEMLNYLCSRKEYLNELNPEGKKVR